MIPTRPKMLLTCGGVLALVLLAGIFYAFSLPPFEKKGEIKASEVCASLGSQSGAVSSLEKLLPDKESYTFDDRAASLRTDDADDTYETSCFVSGDGEQLLVAEARMMANEPKEDWAHWLKGTATNDASVRSLTPFEAGDTAIASDRFAGLFLPCASAGKIPGGQYNISVSVELKRQKETDQKAARTRLIDLVKSAASYAHSKAKCDIPSNVNG